MVSDIILYNDITYARNFPPRPISIDQPARARRAIRFVTRRGSRGRVCYRLAEDVFETAILFLGGFFFFFKPNLPDPAPEFI